MLSNVLQVHRRLLLEVANRSIELLLLHYTVMPIFWHSTPHFHDDNDDEGDDDDTSADDDYTGKLIIGIYRNLSEVCPINSDNFIGSDKFIG